MHHLHQEAILLTVVVVILFGTLLYDGASHGLMGDVVRSVEGIREEEVAKIKITLSVLSVLAGVLLVVYIILRKNDVQILQ